MLTRAADVSTSRWTNQRSDEGLVGHLHETLGQVGRASGAVFVEENVGEEEAGKVLDEIYADNGRPSIPPEHLLKSSLLMAFFTIRSERQFCERLRYNLLFKWFLDLNS